tara:strand:- start:2168 stop:2584 length:417 start_codon:yes stop_codon:yes gene_type:complete
MKKIIYKLGSDVWMMTPTGVLSDEETAEKDVPNGVRYKIIDDSDLPDINFQGAWECDFAKNENVTINLNKAKNITKERLRRERKPLLEAQDVLFMKAQESGSDTKTIVAEKQRLRDITKSVDSCKTTDELKALKCEAS